MKIKIDARKLVVRQLKSAIRHGASRNSSRFIHDTNYYEVEAITRTEKFQKEAKRIYGKFADIGMPVPEGGLPFTPNKGLKWIEQAQRKGIDPYKEVLKLLPIFGVKVIGENVDRYRSIMHGLFNHLFLKLDKSPSEPIEFSFNTDTQGNVSQLWIRIYAHTTKDDLINAWAKIDSYKQHLPNVTERMREWTEFDRDFKLYLIYLKVKAKVTKGELNASVKTPAYKHISQSVYEQLMEASEYKELSRRYKFTRLSLERVIRHCNKALGTLQLL